MHSVSEEKAMTLEQRIAEILEEAFRASADDAQEVPNE